MRCRPSTSAWARPPTRCATRSSASPSAEVAPIAAEIDKTDRFPRELWPKMGELGLHGITVEEEYGGVGPGLSRACRGGRGAEPRLGGGRPVLRRAFQPLRQPDPPQRQRRAEAPLPAQADLRRACRQPGDERVGRRLRRRLDEAARRQEGRPLRAERHQDVDHQQPRRAGGRGLCQDRSRRRLARHHHLHRRDRPQGLQGGAEARQDGHARLVDRRAGVRGLRDSRAENVLGAGRQGRQRADERPRLRARRAGGGAARHHAVGHGHRRALRPRAPASSARRSASSSSCRASSPTCTRR